MIYRDMNLKYTIGYEDCLHRPFMALDSTRTGSAIEFTQIYLINCVDFIFGGIFHGYFVISNGLFHSYDQFGNFQQRVQNIKITLIVFAVITCLIYILKINSWRKRTGRYYIDFATLFRFEID